MMVFAMNDIINPAEKRSELRILVEEFLEREIVEIEHLDSSAAAELFWKLNEIFLKNTVQEGQPDAEDMEGTDLRKILVQWHAGLLPVWNQFKKSVYHFWDEVLPERAFHDAMVKAVEDPSSPMHPHRALMSTAYRPADKFYNLKVKGTAYNVTLTFDAGKVDFFRRDLNIITGFLDTLRNAPVDLFSRCRYCSKVIVITRQGKKYCRGCAAKARQKELWKKDPEGCRERERIRYEKKRKRKKG